jgi:hypothetical protein
MTSKLKTDVLETVSGSGTIALTNQLSGMTSASVPSGSVIQVVSMDTSAGTSLNSTSYVDTPITLTITPSSTSSKILCMWTIEVKLIANDRGIGTKLLRDSATAYESGTSYDVYAGADNDRQRPCWTVLDSPNTTSAVVYKVQVVTYGGAVGVNDAGNSSQITLMEIKG